MLQFLFRNLRRIFTVAEESTPSIVSLLPDTTALRYVCSALMDPFPKLLPLSFFFRKPALSQLSFIHSRACVCVAWSNSPVTSRALIVTSDRDQVSQ